MKYVCELCGYVYDEALGDEANHIVAGTPFSQLPPHYTCSLCGSEKEAFVKAGEQTGKPSAQQTETYAKYPEYRESER